MESQLASNPAPPSSFTAEQKEYLKGFFDGLSQRGLVPFAGHTRSGQITNDPASGSFQHGCGGVVFQHSGL